MDSRRPSEPQSRLSLLGREPSFRRLFLATIGSGAGTWLALVALEIDVYERTGSSAWIAALLIADLLPTFAIGLLVGPLVDRLSRRGLMINADLVRFGAFAVLPFTTSATQVVAIAAVVGVATGFFRPAVYAGLPNLVEDRDLPTRSCRRPTTSRGRPARWREGRSPRLPESTRPTCSTPPPSCSRRDC